MKKMVEKRSKSRIVLDIPPEAKALLKEAAAAQLTDMAHAIRSLVVGYNRAYLTRKEAEGGKKNVTRNNKQKSTAA